MSASDRLLAAAGDLTTAATKVMDEGLPWYKQLGAQERAWVAQVAGAGIRAFLDWYDRRDPNIDFTADVFGAAPRTLTRVISLEQTVALVRTTIGVVESAVDELVEPADRPALREAILRYSREIAFSAAEVYARAAEERGAWDARLEALIVDALLRDAVDDSQLGRLAALGWTMQTEIMVIAGSIPAGDPEATLDALRRIATNHDHDVLTGMHGTVLIAIVGRITDAQRTGRLFTPAFGSGAVVMSHSVFGVPRIPDAARQTLAALRAADGWLDAPRPVHAHELLPERALLGEAQARAELVNLIHDPLFEEPVLLHTAEAFLERAPGIEATARVLFVHPNTVRYRLKRIAEVTGYSPTDPRGAFVLRTGLTVGRLGRTLPIDGSL